MADTTALTAAVAELSDSDSSLLAAITTTLSDLKDEVTALQNAVNSGDQAAVDAATSTVATTVSDLNNAVTQVQAADPGPQPAPPATPPAAPAS